MSCDYFSDATGQVTVLRESPAAEKRLELRHALQLSEGQTRLSAGTNA